MDVFLFTFNIREIQEFLNKSTKKKLLRNAIKYMNEYSSDCSEECPICYNIMNSYVKTKCNHKFHKECLIKSFKICQNCPYCRGDIIDYKELESCIKELSNDYDIL